MWLSFVLIVVLCWLDYQFFTEGLQAHHMAPLKRRVMHLVLLGGITLTGYWGWFKHPMRWIKKLWLASYVIAIGFVAVVGLVQWRYHFFSHNALDIIFGIRIFFCSPAPFFILYLLSRISAGFTEKQQ
jgi:hypothetical protein